MKRGDVFGKLTFVGTVDRDARGRAIGALRCECGCLVKRYEYWIENPKNNDTRHACKRCNAKSIGGRVKASLASSADDRRNKRLHENVADAFAEEFGLPYDDAPRMFAGAIYTYLDD